ncbi:hypothetical protein [Streptomyces sp. B1I3]|uniref:hypothetical protein n=1 Tax=Streptomyces sp. B1I3 TaxID=3042264 RepID=UPI002784CCBF|nr:hypothetical protein [Streptomyces sp. B1I3]MDQ0793934.1 hypothetical protein [Streptomyces sp. B1I3]
MDTTTQQFSGPLSRPHGRTRTAGPADRVRTILREPFRAETWRRTAYILLALPVALVCVPVALLGGPAGRIQRGLARRLLRIDVDEVPRTGPLALVHAVVTIPLDLAAAAFTAYFWFVAAINWGFPLRPGIDPSSSWGGPTMAGAWAVHAAGGGVVFLLLTPWVVKGFTALQARLVAGFLGADRSGLPRTIALALGVAVLCSLVSIPLIHQL